MNLESHEKIKKYKIRKESKEEEINDYQIIQNKKKLKKKYFFRVFIIAFLFILIITIGIILIINLKKEKAKTSVINSDSGKIKEENLSLENVKNK